MNKLTLDNNDIRKLTMNMGNSRVSNKQDINLNININVFNPENKIITNNSPMKKSTNDKRNSSVKTAKFRDSHGDNITNNQLKLKENTNANKGHHVKSKSSVIASNPPSNKLLLQIFNISSNVNLLNKDASSSSLFHNSLNLDNKDINKDTTSNSNNDIKQEVNSKLNSSNILNLSNNGLTIDNSNKKYSKISLMSNITETSNKNTTELIKLSNSISCIEINLHLRVLETLNLYKFNRPVLVVLSNDITEKAFSPRDSEVYGLSYTTNIYDLLTKFNQKKLIRLPCIEYGNVLLDKVTFFRENNAEMNTLDVKQVYPSLLVNYVDFNRNLNEINYKVIEEALDSINIMNYETVVFYLNCIDSYSSTFFITLYTIKLVLEK